MKAVFLDTHVVIWLYIKETSRIPETSKILIESNDLLISPIVFLEIQYLHEIGRINYDSKIIIDDLRLKIGLQMDDLPFEFSARKAAEIQWTRDLFDRLIVANALVRNYSLITKDNSILNNFSLAVWEQPQRLIQIDV